MISLLSIVIKSYDKDDLVIGMFENIQLAL